VPKGTGSTYIKTINNIFGHKKERDQLYKNIDVFRISSSQVHIKQHLALDMIFCESIRIIECLCFCVSILQHGCVGANVIERQTSLETNLKGHRHEKSLPIKSIWGHALGLKHEQLLLTCLKIFVLSH
jgi:hypothetical protein